jgi:hypothetical protein
MVKLVSNYLFGLNLGYSASLTLHRRSELASGLTNWFQNPGRKLLVEIPFGSAGLFVKLLYGSTNWCR